MEFTYKDYEKSLYQALDNNHSVLSSMRFVNLIRNNDLPEKFVILRHDCERDLSKAYKMAKIENKLGIQSSFFIRLHSEWYNLSQPEAYKYLEKISNLGHEIGLHYEPKFYREINCEFIEGIKNDIKFLNNFFEIKSISAHQPLLHPPNKEDFDSLELIDMYTSPYLKNIPYYSDSGMNFREYSLEDVISNKTNCQFLIHPDFWNNSAMSWHENYKLLVEQEIGKLRNFEKYELQMYDNYIKTRKDKDKLFFIEK